MIGVDNLPPGLRYFAMIVLFGLVIEAKAADSPPTIEIWMAKETQSLPAPARINLLAELVKTHRALDVQLLSDIAQQDPDREVKLAAIAQVCRQYNLKRAGRIDGVIHNTLRSDREMLFGIAKIIYDIRGQDKDYNAFVLSALAKWGGPLPWPATIPTSGTVAVEWVPPTVNKKGPIGTPVVVQMDGAEARRAREMVAQIVTMFNQLAGTTIQPGPNATKEMKEWNAKFGGKALEVENWLAKGVPSLQSTDLAEVKAVSFLGTTGTEWLSSGGFQPNGTIVLAGMSLGPTLDFRGSTTKVIGKEGVPGKYVRETAPQKKDGPPEYLPPRWSHPLGTPFVVRLTPDAQRILSVTRLPWGAGGVTGAAVDETGHIYITGPARDNIRAVGGDVQDLPKAKAFEKSSKTSTTPDPDTYASVYIAKLSPEASQVLWVRLIDNPNLSGHPPGISLTTKGQLMVAGPDARLLTTAGKQVTQWDPSAPKNMPSEKKTISLERGLTAYASEHHWPTGHEPWRCPYVSIDNLDGTGYLTLYNWPGPVVGGMTGAVADSPLYGARFDHNGNLVLIGWSDGGNSVLHCEPLDLTEPISSPGLGMNGAGVAGAMSFGYVVRVSTTTWRTIGGTMLCGRNPQFGPGSVRVGDAQSAIDDSLLLVGSSAWGFPQTANNLLNNGHPAGDFIMVLNKNCSMARFSSSMAACGKSVVDRTVWGLSTGKQNGRPMALFLSGAVASVDMYGRELSPPSVKPLQPAYGGGELDGHFVLLDLTAHPAPATPANEEKKK